MDVHLHADGDSMMNPDDDGDCLMAGTSYDFGNHDGVRVRFPLGTDLSDVARALRKLSDYANELATAAHTKDPEMLLRYLISDEAPEPPSIVHWSDRDEVAPRILQEARRVAKARRKTQRDVRSTEMDPAEFF